MFELIVGKRLNVSYVKLDFLDKFILTEQFWVKQWKCQKNKRKNLENQSKF